jgi:histidine kinase
VRFDTTDDSGQRTLTVISPIAGEPGCAQSSCHAHREGETVLGVLVVGLSLARQDAALAEVVEENALVMVLFLVGVFAVLYLVVRVLIGRPVQEMITVTRRIAEGDMDCRLALPQKDELGELGQAIRTMCREIRGKHRELNSQRQLYQDLFEGVPCIITVQDRNFKLLRYNKTFSDLFEVRRGAYCYEAYKGRVTKCPDCPVERTFEDGCEHIAEEMGVYKDGTRAHWIVRTSPLYDREGNIVAAMEMCLDITPRKRLEEELRRSERKYLDIFNNIPSAVFLLEQESLTILDCNKVAATLYGYRRGELIGREAGLLFPPEEAARCLQSLKACQPLNRVRNLRKEGRVFFVNIATAQTEFDGQQAILAAATDVTEHIRAEGQLVQASKMATLGEMATGVAHELNQPLAVLQMVGNLFRRRLASGQGLDPEILAEMADKVLANVERSTRIINHMREFGRKPALAAGEGGGQASGQAMQLNDVVRRAFDFFSQQLRVRGIEAVFDLDEELPLIQADPNRLEQVIINLLLNARDAIAEKCEGADCPQEARRISLRTRGRRRTVLLEVADTGVGIAPEVLNRLFEPFFTTKQVGKGTGLGLSISYGIVQEYGGAIHVRSRPGQGARFVLVFPRVAKQQGSLE